MRLLGATAHGIIDYALVLILAAGPSFAGFRGRQAVICLILAAVHLGLTLATRFRPGVFRIVRFPLHGAIELTMALLLIALPYLAHFSAGVISRNFFIAAGALMGLVWGLTDYRAARDRASGDRGDGPASAAR